MRKALRRAGDAVRRQLQKTRPGRFIYRHRRAEEMAAEALTINVVARILAPWLIAGVASAAITAVVLQPPPYHPPYGLSIKGAAFLTRNEGVRLVPYNDPFNCTTGVGHLVHYGHCSSSDYYRWRLTYAQAEALLVHDVAGYAACVRGRISHRIGQAQFDALVDLSYNAGCGVLDYSGIAYLINRGKLSSVPGRMAVTAVTASGRYLPGLHTRRLAEGTLFRTGYYGPGIGYLPKPKPARPLTARQKHLRALRHKRGFYAWFEWLHGVSRWRGFKPSARIVRPHVPRHVPASWWRRNARMERAAHH